jgi:PPOX class probable F420-dependent enzyme
MPGGQPQSSIIWVDYDGECVIVNTTLERQKGRNICADPRVSILVVDPNDTSRWIEVRGVAIDILSEGAAAHADILTQRYAGKCRFYGDIYPEQQRARETRVVIRIQPTKVSLDAVFR